jgi:hydrogenase maturation protease
MTKVDTLVLGVGNSMRRDDGVGAVIVELLRQDSQVGVDYLNGGVDGLALLDIIQQYKRVIVIDAVDMQAKPGSVRIFSPQEATIKIKHDALSTHGFGLAEVINLLVQLEIKVDLHIVGVQPQDISFGEGLTELVKGQIEKIKLEVNKLL